MQNETKQELQILLLKWLSELMDLHNGQLNCIVVEYKKSSLLFKENTKYIWKKSEVLKMQKLFMIKHLDVNNK